MTGPENPIGFWIDEDGVRHDPAAELLDGQGRNKKMNISFLEGFDPSSANLEELEAKWEKWLDKTNDSPFSYMTPLTRRKFYNGDFPHFNGTIDDFESFHPIIGKPQKYMEEIESTSVGWEVKFVPQESYGEFQEMIWWFRKTMGRNGELFQAPGHQRMVVPIGNNFKRMKAAELTKAAHALIVLEGIAGRVGIETSSYKQVLRDEDIIDGIKDGIESDRGPLRIDDEDRFVHDSVSIEFRAGTKDPRVSRFIQASMASRMSRNDFNGLVKANAWTLVDYGMDMEPDDLVERFGVSRAVARKASEKLDRAGLGRYNVVFWNWYGEDNPMINGTKRALLKDLTKSYLENVAGLRQRSYDGLKDAVRSLQHDWVMASNLTEDVRRYMMPQRSFGNDPKFHMYKPGTRMRVNVNKIDLGVEYSARFPLRFQGDFKMVENYDSWENVRLADDKLSWLQTRVDLSPEEKDAYLKKIAADLRDQLGGEGDPVFLEEDGHGHGLGIAYEIKDSLNRKWRVEWDGIGRNYTQRGTIVDNSVRAGSVEVVTPKFQPTMDEMRAVYKAFEENNALPYIKSGGGT